MRYRFHGEDYFSTRELLRVRLRRTHPNATGCFIEGAYLVVTISGEPVPVVPGRPFIGWTEVRYPIVRRTGDLIELADNPKSG